MERYDVSDHLQAAHDFLAAAATHSHALSVTEPSAVDGSGALSTQELKAVLTRPGGGQPLSDEEVADIIKEFDLNGDVSARRARKRLLPPA